MKRTFLLCSMISAAVVMAGCANPKTAATDSAETRVKARGGLVDPGSVAPASVGPSHQVELHRFQP